MEDDNANAHRTRDAKDHVQFPRTMALPLATAVPTPVPYLSLHLVLTERYLRPKTASQFKPQDNAAVVQEEWRRIPQAAALWLIRSTRRGCVARVRVTAGGPTR